ncbi:MAG TPA: hypothetical protein VKU40_03105 [Thermoanaerobaculia bacterium]|nr:hypothetical protein [Thermoanaerobaculia bacterium]
MNRDKWCGLAVVVGAVGLVVTMVLHPTGGDFEHIARMAAVAKPVHALAIASMLVSLWGFLGLTARLREAGDGWPALAAVAGYVTLAFGSVAGVGAAALNGLATPAYVRRLLDEGADAATLDAGREVIAYAFQLNNDLSRVLIVCLAVAVLLWSAAIVATRLLPRWVGGLGLAASLVALVLFFAGAIGIDVHDFGLFIFGYAAWSVVAGLLLAADRPAT